jgi:hypothetical protein
MNRNYIAPPNIVSRFPLNLDIIKPELATMAGFDVPQLDIIAGSNESLAEPFGPLDHLWDFAEDEALEWLGQYDRPPYVVSKYAQVGEWMPVRRYRAAAALGKILVRCQENVLGRRGQQVLPVSFDPRRRYLGMPEDTTPGSFYEYRTERDRPDLAELYLQRAVRHGYLDRGDAEELFSGLRDRWKREHLEYLYSAIFADQRVEDHADEFFGEMCRGMFHMLRLYRVGEQEALQAAPAQAFDRHEHFHLDRDRPLNTVRINDKFLDLFIRNKRRWLPGVRVSGDSASSVEIARQASDYSPTLPLGATAVEVQRCLTGYVPSAQWPDQRLYEVGFRRSLQRFPLAPGDKLVVKHQDTEEYRTLEWPFRNVAGDAGDAHVVALCRDGRATLLDDFGDEAPSQLDVAADAIEVALRTPAGIQLPPVGETIARQRTERILATI